MIRGTTPTHIFTFDDIDPSELNILNIYYAQQGNVLLEKHKNDCTFYQNNDGSYTASVTLSQEETKLFKARRDSDEFEIQVRVLTGGGKALATPKYRIPIHDVLNDEVLQ